MTYIDQKGPMPVRTSAILTGAYVAGTVIDCFGYNQLAINTLFTKGNLTGYKLKLEFSNDGTNYIQEKSESDSNGAIAESDVIRTMTSSARIQLPVNDRYVKISAIADGADPTGSKLYITAILGRV